MAENFITQFYTWATGNVITADRLNGNVQNLTDGLSGGVKTINVGKVQLNGVDFVTSTRDITANLGTFTDLLTVDVDTANAGATNGILIDQDGTGDSAMSFLLTGGEQYVMGIDNSDGDKFKIADGADFGTDVVTIDASSNVGIVQSSPAARMHITKNEDGVDTEILRLDRTSASPADNDTYALTFYSENDNNEQEDFAKIQLKTLDVSDGTEAGELGFFVADGVDGSLDEVVTIAKNNTTITGTANFSSQSEVVIGGSGLDTILADYTLDSSLQVATTICLYNGSTNTILTSLNVTSITDLGAGLHRINFTNNYASVNYVVTTSVVRTGGSAVPPLYQNKLVSSVEIYTDSLSGGEHVGTGADRTDVSVVIFGVLA